MGRLIDGNCRVPTQRAGVRQQRARGVRLQAGARPLAGELLRVRRGLQLHLDPDRASRRCSGSATSTPGRACGGRGRWSSAARSWSPCASWSSPASTRSRARSTSGQSSSRSGFTSWMTGWIYIVGAIVTIAAVAVDWQVVLPQITTKLQFFGSSADAGMYLHQGRGAERPAARRRSRSSITTIDQHARRQADVADQQRRRRPPSWSARLVLIILLLFHLHQPPSVIVHSYGYRRRPLLGLLRRAAGRRAA